MQEIHVITGGGDRRLRPPNNQAMKCPRCDSINTKFCYYNNYNLSQPRHFCKNCRRYWTKGGVLRNVPVGGGCRKATRRSKPKTETKSKPQSSNSTESSSLTAATTITIAEEEEGNLLKSNTPSEVPLMMGGQILGSLMTSSEQIMGFHVNPTTTLYPVLDHDHDQLKMQEEIGGLDWVNNGGDQSLFDLTAAVDPNYWSQIPWTDNDHSLNYIP